MKYLPVELAQIEMSIYVLVGETDGGQEMLFLSRCIVDKCSQVLLGKQIINGHDSSNVSEDLRSRHLRNGAKASKPSDNDTLPCRSPKCRAESLRSCSAFWHCLAEP